MRVIVVYAVLMLLVSCSFYDDRCNHSNYGLVTVKNITLKREINSFVKRFNINPQKAILTIVISQDSISESYIISTAEDNPFMYKNKPFAYSKIDGIWAVFINAYSNPFDTKIIENSFLCSLKNDSISLSNGYMFYNPHYLRLKLCKGTIIKEHIF